jgi:hypothetical protein
MDISLLISKAIDLKVASEATIKGCTEDEIQRLVHQSPFLGEYKEILEFYRRAGRQFGDLYVGSNVFFPECLSNPSAFKVHSEHGSIALPKKYHVFMDHQGYYFLVIDLSDERSKFPIFESHDSDLRLVKRYESFFLMINAEIYDCHNTNWLIREKTSF